MRPDQTLTNPITGREWLGRGLGFWRVIMRLQVCEEKAKRRKNISELNIEGHRWKGWNLMADLSGEKVIQMHVSSTDTHR